jgi:hypothetical protein
MSDYEKILIGESIPLEEVDDEESNLDDMIPAAELNADLTTIINYFGTEEFKGLYLNLYNEIRSFELEKQRELCEKLISKISNDYSFDFFPQLTFDNKNDTEEFFKFIEFLEYDYIDFLSEIISGLDLELLKKDINEFLTLNWNQLVLKINSYQKNEIISKFLRTNNKEGLYDFIRSRLEKDKMLVILNSLEREM